MHADADAKTLLAKQDSFVYSSYLSLGYCIYELGVLFPILFPLHPSRLSLPSLSSLR